MGGMVSDSEEDSPPRTRRSQPRRVPTRKSSRRRPRGAIVSSKRTIPLLEGSGQVVSDARSIKTSSSSVFYDAEDQDAVEAAHEKPRTNRDRKLAAVPHHQMNTMKQVNGIDNVTLLMEDDSYHLACFSMYLFKTTLDYKTVREFFEVLVQLYPKYRYVVDFQPYTARRRDRLRRKQREDVAEQARKERNEKMKRGELPPNHGPRTLYSRSLKSGSWLRPAQWRIDEDFHVSENIEVISCGGTGTEDQVYKIAGRFLARHFDYNKPVWEALLIQGLNTSEGAKSALMIKIHHCFSDGQGMIQSYHAALMAMSKDMGIKEVQQWVDVAKKKNKANKKKEIKPTIGGTVSHSFYTMRELYFRKRKSFVYRNPKQARASQRLYYHSDGIPMAGIKRIRETFSTPNMHLTLNDVAVAILARAMALAANRLSPRGSKDDRRAAIFVPVSIRPEGNWDLYNYTTGAMVWLKYPDLDATPVSAQLAHVHKEMLRIKKSYLPSLWYHTFNEICKHRGMYVPNYPIARSIFYRAFSEYHVATNVPGPTEPVMFGKHQAYSYHVLPPSSPGKATMAIGMISYAANFSLAVSCDDVPEFKDVPRVLCDAFSESSKLLIEAAENHLAQAPSEKN
ncbi:diacylglycerol O-acyltransferase [Malassezia pachydermatis]